MIEAITYCADVTQLSPSGLIELDETGSMVFNGTKTQTIRNGVETLSLVRVTSLQDLFNSGLTVLASSETGEDVFEIVFSDPDAKEIYDRVYDQSPVDVTTSDDEQKRFYYPPKNFGSFA